MTTLTIGSNVTSIGMSAFSDCTKLTDVINHSIMPQPITIYVFYNLDRSKCTLHVPEGSLNAYRNATAWKDFKPIVAIAGGSDDYALSVSTNSLSFIASGEQKSFTVTSNTNWTVVSSNTSWCTVSPASGSDNGTVTVTTAPNTTPNQPRTATITVSGTGVTAQTISVTQAAAEVTVDNVTVSPIGMTLVAGTLATVRATVTPAAANQNVTWSSGNPAIATVDNNGNVTGKAAGTTDITATAQGGKKASCEVKVISGTSAIEGTVQQSGYQPTEPIMVALYMQQATGFTSSVKSSVPAGYVQVAVTTPDATGKYRFANLPDGDYVVVVSVAGKESSSGAITLTPGANVPGVNFTLNESGTVTTNPAITRVSVSAAAAVKQGATLQFTVDVEAHGGVSANVTWSVAGKQSTATTVNSSGLLTVATDEKAETLTVTATSTVDLTKKGTATVSVQTVTGTDELFAPNLKIYPNPFVNVVQVIGADGCMLRVINSAGVAVHIQKTENTDEIIRLEHLPAGVYFFTFEKDGRTKTVKVVKE